MLDDQTQNRETLMVSEAAQRLGLSIRATRRAIASGEIPEIRIGRRLLVLRAPFERMLLATSSKGSAEAASADATPESASRPMVQGDTDCYTGKGCQM